LRTDALYPENIEAVGDAGIPYDNEFDLADKLQRVLRDGSLSRLIVIAHRPGSDATMIGIRSLISMKDFFATMSGKGKVIQPATSKQVGQAAEILSRK